MINIRPATISDTEGIVRLKYAAIHGPAPSAYYNKSVLDSWSPSPEDETQVKRFRQAIQNNEKIFIIAEPVENCIIIGAASLIVSEQTLDDLYVDPAFSHQGIGSKLLAKIEELALLHGIDKLYLTASLNGESFYCHHGFLVEKRDTHRMSSGVDMDYVSMSKKLHKD